jgi:hypothetical protein
MSEFCEPNCPYLKLKENEQDKSNQPHICTWTNIRLYHYDAHPEIYRNDYCRYKEKP